jgi:site-specific recombinase XerD
MTDDIDKKNNIILEQFEANLKQDGLSTKTIKSHLGSLEFFCTYLSYYEPYKSLYEMNAGDVSDFLSDFFPRKAMWACPSNVKSYIATFKKFFRFSLEHNYIPLAEYDYLLTLIKEDKELWIEASSFNEDDIEW